MSLPVTLCFKYPDNKRLLKCSKLKCGIPKAFSRILWQSTKGRLELLIHKYFEENVYLRKIHCVYAV